MTDEGIDDVFMNPTYAFKEKRCRGFGTELSVKLGDRYGEDRRLNRPEEFG
ncbi:hypothetical protein OH492_10170 [Vibrio chagasii]|nr:hypothetical protein [Vibrio chagasii]